MNALIYAWRNARRRPAPWPARTYRLAWGREADNVIRARWQVEPARPPATGDPAER